MICSLVDPPNYDDPGQEIIDTLQYLLVKDPEFLLKVLNCYLNIYPFFRFYVAKYTSLLFMFVVTILIF